MVERDGPQGIVRTHTRKALQEQGCLKRDGPQSIDRIHSARAGACVGTGTFAGWALGQAILGARTHEHDSSIGWSL